jgi:hypothetical protein
MSNWAASFDGLEEEPTVADTTGPGVAHDDTVYAPDQFKPGNRKWSRIGAVGSALVLLAMVIGNHEGNTENVFLIVLAVGLVVVLVLDAVLRRNGIR